MRPALQYGEVRPTGTETVSPFDFMTPTGKEQVENEKCLSVNVWTRSLRSEARRPVVVWLHGGGFSSGSSSELPYYDGRNLAGHGNTVFVSVSHRPNVLGFMDLSAHGAAYQNSGNLGMLDIEAALKWVRDNIAHFGGDPGNVTIVGQSGGAAKVLTLMGMPSAKGLFHKAVVSSGQASGRPRPDAQAQTAAVFGELGITTVDQLEQVPHRTLLAAADRARFSASPVIDGTVYPERTVTAEGKFSALSRDVPLMVSNTFAEFSTNAGAMITQSGVANPLPPTRSSTCSTWTPEVPPTASPRPARKPTRAEHPSTRPSTRGCFPSSAASPPTTPAEISPSARQRRHRQQPRRRQAPRGRQARERGLRCTDPLRCHGPPRRAVQAGRWSPWHSTACGEEEPGGQSAVA